MKMENDIIQWITDIPQNLQALLGGLYNPVALIAKIIAILVITFLLVKFGSKMIKKALEKQKSFKLKPDEKRIDTMSTLLVSIFRYTVYILSGVAILTLLTNALNLQSIMAAAGIGGIAVGFGAQSLIKDVISGAFIVFENQYSVGDNVTLEGRTGFVEEIELRVTKVRDSRGDLHIIPNGEIKKVTNHSRGNKTVIVDIPLAYKVDINRAFETADRVCKSVSKEFDTIVEEPRVLGITELGKDNLTLRITAKTVPGEHWGVERRIRKLVKEEFDRENIEFFDRYKVVLDGTEGGE
ncbi:MAG TPA: mechanosensitive ion channel family protein [Clostridium sp.]|uniref:Mechanosensitive ion channel family protein n=2 Tax=Acetivibrio mesophilus TaxID=2487273 RepID=A0A4Q0I1L1_9FIRM|nr:mechanosensitive ion channel protein [Clostridium sp. Bc-iso-3]RXE58058.1 mechanosensitive ion channel family protein [Acetivibrio mesophilus]HHV29782.1 mechanosensitive ion channel family protein [Clostridium sp.]